ncbi:MAG: hypothetical protein ACOC0U_02780 [Desulfovibrionales bacterium]
MNFFISGQAEANPSELQKRYAVSLYGGTLTDGHWEESVILQTDFVDSHIVAGGFAWTYKRADSNRWSLEMEANMTKHIGDQNHWEFNFPIFGARWHAFPWDEVIETSSAFGVGLSYATDVPEVEEEIDGPSRRLMVYWHYELTFGPPGKNWTPLIRLHHRSPGYGLFGEDGGSNALTMGVRFYL